MCVCVCVCTALYTRTVTMSVSVDIQGKAEDLGKLLAKVQDDLAYLRATAARAQDGELDMKALDLAISRTEKGVAAAAESVLASSQNQVLSLPTVSQRPSLRRPQPLDDLIQSVGTRNLLNKEARLAASKRTNTGPGISPGQQVRVDRVSHLISLPSHPLTRQMLNTHYNLPTSEGQSTKVKGGQGQVMIGSTVDPLTSLPRANRRDAQVTPPTICEHDAQRGLLNLLERGLIPPAADIILSPPPVRPRPVPLHPPAVAHTRTKIAEGTLTGLKLDTNPLPERYPVHLPNIAQGSYSTTATKEGQLNKQTIGLSLVRSRPQTPPATPDKNKDPLRYKVAVQNGCVVDNAKEFLLFKKAFRSKWPHVKTALNCVEELCRAYAVPIAVLDGDKVSKMALDCELGLRPSQKTILSSLLNREEVINIINTPGQRYKGHRGIHAAAAKIQATYRMSVQRREYIEHRCMKRAAGAITMWWLLLVKASKIREEIKTLRAEQLVRHHKRMVVLHQRWAKLKGLRRTIVHLPSLGYSQPVRAGLTNFRASQALQLSRLCDLCDPNVEVLYISPIPVEEDILDYYVQLLSMEGHQNIRERVHIITPENYNVFGHHNLSLATYMLYSPRALRRVRNLLKGKEAYIVPGVVSRDDITLADKLNLPLLGPDHELTQHCSSRPGFKRILTEAGVSVPPSLGEVFSEEQLIDKLAQLVVNHPTIERWLFKLPDHVRAKGFAYCDVSVHLSCHSWLMREAQRYGDKWCKRWAQEKALQLVSAELPAILANQACPIDSKLFPSWKDYLKVFLSQGGLIEGSPPSESVTSLSVDMLVEPTGELSIVAMRDQILSPRYVVWGSSLPQSSVPPGMLVRAALIVGSEVKARGVIGYFTVDFLTFISPATGDQELWAVDLDLGLTDHTSLTQLLTCVTDGRVDSTTGQLLANSGTEERFAVMSPHLMHTNLNPIYYPIFFQICKAHFIQYDTKKREGTVFALVDSQHREWLGMLCIQDSLLKALKCCSLNLSTLHQEISTTHMPGRSNFKAASEELDAIAELMDYNQTEHTQDSSD